MTLGQRIMQIRVQAGLSQEEFGEMLKTSRQTVSKWELDQTLPEIAKIVKMSKIFSVTTDSILSDGISSFDDEQEKYVCGIYKSDTIEIVETQRISLVYYSNKNKSVFGVKVYTGFDSKKKMQAFCEHNKENNTSVYAYSTDKNEVISNSKYAEDQLGKMYDSSVIKSLYRAEAFTVADVNIHLPTVEEAGIKNCLMQWRSGTKFRADISRFTVILCTDKSEYAVDLDPRETNLYCCIGFNIATQMGLLSCNKEQVFRIRSYGDNTQNFCRSYCNFGLAFKDAPKAVFECAGGAWADTPTGVFMGVKRYNNDEIVICNCGDDELIYSRFDDMLERFVMI